MLNDVYFENQNIKDDDGGYNSKPQTMTNLWTCPDCGLINYITDNECLCKIPV